VEPFAGGGIIGLTAVAEGLVDRALLVELDPNVAVVWEVLINGDAEQLARRIERFDFNDLSVRAELAKSARSDVSRAFQTVLRNRAQRGGIMAPRARMMKDGDGKGIASRWYPETLARRIRDIVVYRDRVDFIHGDGVDVMAEHRRERSTALFVDPPYTAGRQGAGSRLYTYSDLDHERLFTLAERHAGGLLLTYDDSSEVRELARRHELATCPIAMRSTHNAKKSELLISRDLSWVR
jgi:DNA adenine methylase